MSKLISFFPNYKTEPGIFSRMVDYGAPWDIETASQMDDIYLTMYSGLKTPSNFTLLHSDNGVASVQDISKLLWFMYSMSWKRMWESYSIEYSAIDNYSVNETFERNTTNTRTTDKSNKVDTNNTLTSKDTTDMSQTVNGTFTHGHVIDRVVESENTVFGFDSVNAVPSEGGNSSTKDTNSGDDVTNNTTTNTGTIDTNTTNTLSTETTENVSDKDSEIENLTRVKTGNVGQNSYQELLRQELELRKWNFFRQVFDDCDKYLVLSIYDICSTVN